jgi:hypothetical protein
MPLCWRRWQAVRAACEIADIAGGGFAPGDTIADRHTTETEFCRRHEPVHAPDVSLPDCIDVAALGPGEAILHVVVRSDASAGLGIAEYAARFDYRLGNERVTRPPSASQAIAERHGHFDSAAPRHSCTSCARR